MFDEDRVKHTLFGQVSVVKKLFTSNIIYDCKVRNFSEATQWQNRSKQLNIPTSCGLLLPESVELIEKKDEHIVRVTVFFTQIKYGSSMFLLQDEKLNRRKYQIPFKQQELWFLLYSLIDTSKIIYHLGSSILQISPSSILMDQYGHVKIFCEQSAPNYNAIMQSNKKHAYCRSPQEMLVGTNKGVQQAVNRAKAQSFEIGITMMEIALLDSCEQIFRFRPHIDKKQLSEALQRVRRSYSQFFCNILECMIEEDPEERASTSEMWAILYPYSESIQAVEKFRSNRESSNQCLQTHLSNLKTMKLYPY